VRRGSNAYLAASILSQAAALLRYVLLARILGPRELGLAAMLILTSQFFESISDTGSDRFLIQDADGDTPVMQGFVQLVMSLRGGFIALALAITAAPLAILYKAPELAPALIVLGLSPLIAGFVHLDIRRMQRHGDFRQESVTTILGETAGLICTVLAAWFVRDHTAVIYGLVARSAAMVLVSQIAAQRPYRWAYSRVEAMRFSQFAAPLFLNGLLLFAGSQGDRLLVGSRVGPTALGQYSAIMLLIYYPSSALAKFITGMHLPQIAAGRDEPVAMERESGRLAGRTLLLAVLMATGFTLVGPIVTPLLYGHAFAQAIPIFAFLGCLQSARFLRAWPTTMAVAIGRSSIVMFNNIARMVAVPAAIAAALIFHSLEAIIGGFYVGEIVALVVALTLLSRAATVSLAAELQRVAAFLVISALLVLGAWSAHDRHLLLAGLTAAATCGVLVWIAFKERAAVADLRSAAMRRLVRA
jgi:O-antigen/teichoic acid export membrane protein